MHRIPNDGGPMGVSRRMPRAAAEFLGPETFQDGDTMVGAGQALAELERRTAMLDAVAYAASRMLATRNWRSQVPRLLEKLGRATAMSRVTMFEVHKGRAGERVQSCRYDWAEPGLATISDDPRYHDMPLDDDGGSGELDQWSQRRERGEVVQATLREVTGYTRQVFLEHGTLAFLSVPIMVEGRWWGFLGFDDCRHERVWNAAEIGVLKTAAALIAGAVERERTDEQLREAERKRASLARYFSPNMVEELMLSGGRLDAARSQVVSVLFADVWGFTRVSADLPGMEVIALLREYLGLVEDAVFAHGGTLDKFLGDGLMATFGTPQAGRRDAANALACATTMAAHIVAWNDKRKAEGLQPLRLGVGLHHGEVVLGDIGSQRRMEFAVVGDTVNVASRIQEMTRTLDIAIVASDTIISAARSQAGEAALAGFSDLGTHELRGRRGELRLWGRAAEPG